LSFKNPFSVSFFMVYQLVLRALRGIALRDFSLIVQLDKVVLRGILSSAEWGCTLPWRVFVEHGLYSILCATPLP
jgi:hypothetical protein